MSTDPGGARRVRIKFCGMTSATDALEAVRLGVDAIGLIFVPTSRRRVSPSRAREIALALPPLVARVGLFQDADEAEVRAVLAEVPLDVLQFHGGESAAYCASFGRPYLKAVPMAEANALALAEADHPQAQGYVLDAHQAGSSGGTGRRFDWSLVPRATARPILLAGGLTPENVHDAIVQVRPYGVDVVSGIEAGPGLKDYARMAAFVSEVERARLI